MLALHSNVVKALEYGLQDMYAQLALLSCSVRVTPQLSQSSFHTLECHAVLAGTLAIHEVGHRLVDDTAIAPDACDGLFASGATLDWLAVLWQRLQAHALPCMHTDGALQVQPVAVLTRPAFSH